METQVHTVIFGLTPDGVLNAIVVVLAVYIAWRLSKADKARDKQTTMIARIEGSVATHGTDIAVLKTRVDGHDRELGRLNDSVGAGRRRHPERDQDA